jgi:hypothetical protein
MSLRLRTSRRLRRWLVAGLMLGGLATFVLIYFAPQDLFLNTSANEPLPTVHPTSSATKPSGASTPAHTTRPARASSSAPALRVLARGKFHNGEHHTSGEAVVLRLPDSAAYVRLHHFATSNGPDVRIWLSTADAHASDDAVQHASHLDLGGLKANHGNQNYRVPASASLARYHSVVVWCRRFDVVFGAAPARS